MIESFKIPSATFPTLTGSIVTFNSQYAGLPLKSHAVDVVATQSGSGTPSPSNPRPITGYSAINISHSDADTSTPTVHTITIGSTIYGGEYDARTGLLTVTHGFVDMGTLDYVYASFGGINYFRSLTTINADYTNEDYICEVLKAVTYSQGVYGLNSDNTFFINTNLYIYLRDDSYTDATALKTAYNGKKIKYKLATPTTIQLQPCPIDTLEENNIWADTGDTTLQYSKFG